MGDTRYKNLSKLAKDIWYWCEQRNLGIFASYIRSEENTIADSESRKREHETEFGLSKYAFDMICRILGKPEIDLFASRTNAKCSRYVSWRKDPNAITIDAFTINWQTYYFYAFPPFSVILKMLRKTQSDQARGIIVVPHWPSQAWYPLCIEMFESKPIYFKPDIHLLLTLTLCVQGTAPVMEKSYPGCRNIMRQALTLKGMPEDSLDIAVSSLSNSSIRQYETAYKKWWSPKELNSKPKNRSFYGFDFEYLIPKFSYKRISQRSFVRHDKQLSLGYRFHLGTKNRSRW